MTTTVVRGKHVLTSAEVGAVADGAVAFEDGKIIDVGKWDHIGERHKDAEVVGDGFGIVMPGLVNCHGHFSEGLITGLGENMSLFEWIERIIRPVAPHITREMAKVGATLKSVEMLASGVTTVNDMFVCLPGRSGPITPGVVEALDQVGLRGQVSFGAQDAWGAVALTEIFDEHEALAAAAALTRRIQFRLGIATVLLQSRELFRRSIECSHREGWAIHTHFHEVREEVTSSRIANGKTVIEHAAQAGLLDLPVLGAHCVWVSDNDVRLLARHGVSVAYNPVANMILASGICPVRQLRREGIHVGLGTDGPASNDSQDMLQVVKIAALVQKLASLDATAMSAPEVLEMATIEGARALGISTEVGSLERGKQADLVLLSGNSPALANIHDPYQAVVYCAGGRDVSDVWVAGERILRAGRPVNIDTDALFRAAREQASFLVKKSGLSLSVMHR